MRGWTLAIAFMFVACTGNDGPAGPPGAQGAQGAQGQQGPPGPASDGGSSQITLGDSGVVVNVPRVVWVDKNNNPVYALYPTANGNGLFEFFVADSNGFVWVSQLFDGTPSVPLTNWGPVYTEAGCSGTPYVIASPPSGFVFTIIGDDTTYRTIPADGSPSVIALASQMTLGGCQPSSGNALAVPASSTIPATAIVKPASLFTPPVRPIVR